MDLVRSEDKSFTKVTLKDTSDVLISSVLHLFEDYSILEKLLSKNALTVIEISVRLSTLKYLSE